MLVGSCMVVAYLKWPLPSEAQTTRRICFRGRPTNPRMYVHTCYNNVCNVTQVLLHAPVSPTCQTNIMIPFIILFFRATLYARSARKQMETFAFCFCSQKENNRHTVVCQRCPDPTDTGKLYTRTLDQNVIRDTSRKLRGKTEHR